jgi:(S)-3,5-dihydroxyphenylglycine transaminase
LVASTGTIRGARNEVAGRYPAAISLASGRPFEGFFDMSLIQGYIETFARYLKDEKGCNDEGVRAGPD